MKTMMAMKSVAIITALLLTGAGANADDELEFEAELSGANEVPPVETEAVGEAEFEVDEDFSEIKFKLKVKEVDGILGVAGAHIHCAPHGENGPVVVFLAGAVPGGFVDEVEVEATFTDANVINDACGANVMELVESMLDGNTYVNVHSPDFPGGEVRGQIVLDD